jgi:hypothetical protein
VGEWEKGIFEIRNTEERRDNLFMLLYPSLQYVIRVTDDNGINQITTSLDP